MNAQVIVINEGTWKKFTPAQREQITKAAAEVRQKASDMVKNQEADETEKLRQLKMTVIGPAEGLNLDAFRASVTKAVDAKFAAKYGDMYKAIAAIR
jgi:TRAP-type C4-dicarboxylate transport system substrate-binding protein